MTEIRPGLVWLTIADAATRVRRSEATIRRWHSKGHIVIRLGRVDEAELLRAERTVRAQTRARTTAALQARNVMRTLGINVPDPCPAGRETHGDEEAEGQAEGHRQETLLTGPA